MESWKVNLISVWFGCFFTGLAISQILPFLPLYVSQLGVTSHEALSMWSGLTFSVTFLVSAIVSPMWGSLADRKGRKLMLLRASLGMAIAILLQAFATNVWQLFILRAIMGLTSGYIPNAMALVASQVPRERSGWALSTLSTAQISGVIGGPLLGGFLADHVGLRMVFFITAILLTISFLVTLFLIKEGVRPQVSKSERLTGKQVFASLPYPGLVISLFFTTPVIQLCNGSIGPILALFIKSMAPDSNNIAFLAGMIAAVPGVSALISAPRLGKLGDRIGTSRILLATLCCAVVMFFAFSCLFTLSPQNMADAKAQNIPVLSYLANHFASMSGTKSTFATLLEYGASIIALVAIFKSFFGHYLGTLEGLNGLILRFGYKGDKTRVSSGKLNTLSMVFIMGSTWVVAYANPNILDLIEAMGAPIIASLLCLLPMYAIRKAPSLAKYRGRLDNLFVTAIGLLTILNIAYKLF